MNSITRKLLQIAALTLISSSLDLYAGTWTGFTAAPSPVTGAGPQAIATGDFNRDGKLDLAVANVGAQTVSILLGNGDGTFTATASSPVTGTAPEGIAVSDLNNDGKLDIVVANHNSNDFDLAPAKRIP